MPSCGADAWVEERQGDRRSGWAASATRQQWCADGCVWI